MPLAAILVVMSLGAAQRGPAEDVPKFRSSTHLVQINVVVRDKNGPVTGLKKDDFFLTDAGSPQAISVFSAAPSRTNTSKQSALPEGVFSNRMAASSVPGSVTIVLLDRLNTLTSTGLEAYEWTPTWFEDHTLGFAKQRLIEFVKQLDARDRVAIYSLGESLTVLSDFTNDREQLLRVLSAYRATSLTDREKVDPGTIHTPVPGDFNARVDQDRQKFAATVNATRAEITMASMMAIASHVAAIPGRKNLIWLTADLPFSGAAMARILGRANVAVYPVDARGLLPRALPGPEDEMGVIAGPHSQPLAADLRPRGQDFMEQIADNTGGRAFTNTNDLAGAIHSAVEDSEGNYTVGFYPEGDALDGKFHALRVHLKQVHAELHYPRGYFAMKDIPVAAAETETNLVEATHTPLESASIHLLARVLRVDRPKPNSISISASIDLHDIELVQSGDMQKGAVDVRVIQQDVAGRIIGHDEKRVNLQVNREDYAKLLKSGVFFRELIESKPGLATLRILAADTRMATTGSLIIPAANIK